MNRLNLATRALIKGNIKQAAECLTGEHSFFIDPTTYTTPDAGSWFFELLNGNPGYFKHTGLGSCADAYRRCAPVAAIINRKAQTYINGTTYVYNLKGKAKDKEATSEPAIRLQNLFKRPNPLQSGKQFEAQGYIYWNLFGFNIVLCMKPVGFDRTYTSSMWNIPASWLNITETKRLWYLSGEPNIRQIVLDYNGVRTTLNIDDLFIMKDNQPSFETAIFPASKLEPLALVINNIIGAYESRNVLINYRGALGLLTQDQGTGQYAPIAMDTPEKEQLQKDFKRYGLTKHQWQVIITSASMKWQQMGYATKDLMLFEEVEDGIARLCDGIGYPDFLISSRTKTTFDNVQQGMKMLYQDFTIPDACSIYEQWEQWFGVADFSLGIEKNFEHIPVLQEDRQKMAAARLTMNQAMQMEWDTNQLTLNEWRTKNGEDPLTDELGGNLTKREYNEQFGQAPPDGGATGQAQGSEEGQNQSTQSNNQ